MAEAIAVVFTAPLFVTALSGPVLGEKVGIQRWAGVALGFIGMLIIVRPGSAAFQTPSLIIIFSAFTFAFTVFLTRTLTRTETNLAIYTYTTIFRGNCHGLVATLCVVNTEPGTPPLVCGDGPGGRVIVLSDYCCLWKCAGGRCCTARLHRAFMGCPVRMAYLA